MGAKRIYIGGLTADIKDSDIVGRFKPFGDVLSTEVIKAKAVGADPDSCRGFAYVTLSPKDDASLARMLSLYNGCKWRGQKLRVELAKPDYATRLQAEWQADKEQEEALQEHTEQQEQQQLPASSPEPDAHLLRLTVPGPKKKTLTVDLTTKSKSHRSWFSTHKMKRPHELDWEPLPPSKRAAMQAAAEAVVPRAPGPPAHLVLQQLRDEAAAQHVRDQQQLLQVQSGNGLQPRGVAVPFSYQQQQPVGAAAAKKGSSKVVQQELMGQLKLLKRIAEREQQQQPQQRGSRSSKAVVDFPDEPGSLHQQLVSMKADDAIATAAAAAAGAEGVDVLLSRFDDSDSDGDGDAAGRTGQLQGLLVAAAPACKTAAAAADTAVLAPSKQRQQLLEKGVNQGQPQAPQQQLCNKPHKQQQQEVVREAAAPAGAKKHQQQQQQQLWGPGRAQPLQQGQGDGGAAVSSPSSSGSEGSADAAGDDSDYGSDQWEQWLAAEGITNTADQGPGTTAAAAAGSGGAYYAEVTTAPGAGTAGGPASPSSSHEDISSDGDDAAGGGGLPAWTNACVEGADGDYSSDDDVAATSSSGGGSEQQPDTQPVLQQQQQQGWGAGRVTQQPGSKAQRPLSAKAAAAGVIRATKQHKPTVAAAGARAAVAGRTDILDRFGSDSEEVLVDVDDEGVDADSIAAVQGKRRLQRGDMLLCPKPRAKARR